MGAPYIYDISRLRVNGCSVTHTAAVVPSRVRYILSPLSHSWV